MRAAAAHLLCLPHTPKQADAEAQGHEPAHAHAAKEGKASKGGGAAAAGRGGGGSSRFTLVAAAARGPVQLVEPAA